MEKSFTSFLTDVTSSQFWSIDGNVRDVQIGLWICKPVVPNWCRSSRGIAIVGGTISGLQTTLFGIFALSVVLGVSGYRFWTSYTAQLIKRPHSELEVPMLTIVSAWMFASLLHPYSGQGIILGALCLGWFHTQDNERERGLAHMRLPRF